jgi:EAL domain-containing protein (putative c-di-GMP-specific phosphodiesterase class I)
LLLDRYQLGVDVDRWVLGKLVGLGRREPAFLATSARFLVPLSRQALVADDLLAWLDARLREDPTLGSRLGFSIDTAGVGGERERMRYFVSTVAQHGCQVMLTNPGLAGAALDLLRIPGIALLGIDQALVSQVQDDSAAYEAILGLCRMARACGLRSMAFGAANTILVDTLGRMGVDYTVALPQTEPRPTIAMPRDTVSVRAICSSRPGTASARTSG